MRYSKDEIKNNHFTTLEYILYRLYVIYFVKKEGRLHFRVNFLHPISWILLFYFFIMLLTIQIVSIFTNEN